MTIFKKKSQKKQTTHDIQKKKKKITKETSYSATHRYSKEEEEKTHKKLLTGIKLLTDMTKFSLPINVSTLAHSPTVSRDAHALKIV